MCQSNYEGGISPAPCECSRLSLSLFRVKWSLNRVKAHTDRDLKGRRSRVKRPWNELLAADTRSQEKPLEIQPEWSFVGYNEADGAGGVRQRRTLSVGYQEARGTAGGLRTVSEIKTPEKPRKESSCVRASCLSHVFLTVLDFESHLQVSSSVQANSHCSLTGLRKKNNNPYFPLKQFLI